MTDFCLIVTSTPDQALAEKLAKTLLEQRLAACVQLLPMQSFYHWQDAIAQSPEMAVWIKSRRLDFDAVAACISALHSYEVPEIIQVPLTAISDSYQTWLENTLRHSLKQPSEK